MMPSIALPGDKRGLPGVCYACAMKGIVVAAVVLAGHAAAADVTTLVFGEGHALEGWKAEPAAGFAVTGGELVQTQVGHLGRDLPLDARGWAVEARFALGDSAAVEIVVVDDRLTTRFTRGGGMVTLDGESFEVPAAAGIHTYRIEASTGRRLLLVDGQVVVDHDVALPNLTLEPAPKITLGGLGQGAGSPLVRWQALVVDTAPSGLALSALPYQPGLRFTGPFATWFYRFAGRAYQVAAPLAQLQLPERARACVAFDLVAAAATPRPKHYRRGELARLPKHANDADQVMIDPQIDFDLIESPRPQARKPMMRRRRVAADIRAQAELAGALAARDPRPFYDRAVMLIINEGSLPAEALTWLMAELPGLAQHPDACR